MSITKFIALAAVAATTTCAFADAKEVSITYWTKGPDCYAGSTDSVAVGEWYALCWTPNETFGGITTSFAPAVAGDRILKAVQTDTAGRCWPATKWVFSAEDATKLEDGKFFVVLLDTRDAEGKPSEAVIKDGMNVPAMINGEISNARYALVDSMAVKTTVVGSEWGETKVDTTVEGFTQPKIAAFAIDGDKAVIKVTGMVPGIKYNVQAGESIEASDTFALDVPLTKESNGVEFEVNKDKGKFFKVVREPLTK